MSKENKHPDKDVKKSTSIKYKLQYPIDWGEEGFVTEIEFKRPKGKHIKSIGKNASMDDIFRIAGKISGYTPAFFDELDAADCVEISEIIGDFLDGGRGTGRTVSP